MIEVSTPYQSLDIDPLRIRNAMIRDILLIGGLVSIVLAWHYHPMLAPFAKGVMLALVYTWSLFISARSPKKGVSQAISLLRMVVMSFLIIWLGQFHRFETLVVLIGFLSYKLSLVFEWFQLSKGMKLSRGK